MEAATEVLNSIPSPVPQSVWEGELRRRLREDERAAVGEIGLDRAAVIPGTRVQVRIEHQMALVKAQVALAAEFARPVSVHCVRAHGHLEEFLRGLPMDGAPPRVMLHSYNGSVEMARRFLALPNGLGSRVFFSFNTVVKNKREAVIERIRAVPDDRVLAESDATDVSHVEEWLGSSCDIIAEAKGWSREEAARRLRENFRTFYGLHEAP